MTAETSPAPRRRIVFLDVDGTIMEHGERVARSTVEAIRAARAAGHLVLLSTGRSEAHLPPVVTDIGFDGAVTNSGADARIGEQVVLSRTLGVAQTRRMLDVFESLEIGYLLQTNDGVFAEQRMTAMLEEFRRALEQHASGPEDLMSGLAQETFPDVAEAELDAVTKAVFMSERPDGIELVRAGLGGEFHVVPGSIPLPGGSNGEVNQAGITKGAAIEVVLAELGLDAADAVAIGDSWNDIEMFGVCGLAIAMGNAPPEVRAHADEVTTDVTDDGIHHAFARHGLL